MKILYVVKNLRITNGVSSYLMNYYRKLIKTENIQLDFLIISDVGSPYYDEIKQNGGKIFVLPSLKHPIKYIKELKKIFKNNKYDILHSNVINSNALIAFVAWVNGVKIRILHSHITSNGDTFLKKVRNIPFHILSLLNSNHYFACSELAGKKILWGKKFSVIPNAIDVDKYKYNTEYRNQLRSTNNIKDNTIIIGVVGRITHVKNPYFILNIAECLKKDSVDFKIWWFGSGDMDEEVFKKTDELELNDYIKFFGSVPDVYKYYSAMDCFILPSFFEGLPVVGIEAQTAGLKCLFSNTITEEAQLTPNTEFLTIEDCNIWKDKIKDCLSVSREDIFKSVDLTGYSIESIALSLLDKYKSLIEKR